MAHITFKGNPVSTNANLPQIGEKAGEFRLVDRELKDHFLKDYKGKRKLLAIVPSLDTSVCSTMTKKINDGLKDHPEVVGIVISADLPFAQSRFCTNEGIKNVVTLSMMRSKDFAKDYGILIQEGPLEGICARSVLVLDENDIVVYRELVPEITKEPNYDKALEALFKKLS